MAKRSGLFQSDRIGRESVIGSLRRELDLLNRLMEEADRSIEDEDYARIHPGEMREVADLIEGVIGEYDQRSYYLGRNIRNIKALLTQLWLNGIPERWSATVVNLLFHTNMELIGAAADNAKGLMNNVLLGGESGRSADVILGMGGIGKTTLAAWMYNSYPVVVDFEVRVWITITDGCVSAEEILRLTARRVPRFQWLFEMSMEELADSVMESLRGKRYLVVFDNVSTINLWDVVRAALPDDGLGSRVIVTTSNAAVADSSERIRVHRVERLAFDESWELFCRTAFRLDPEGRCPEELQPASVKIVGICRGFPLIIKVLAGLLSMKPKVAEEWGTMLFNLEKRLLSLHLDVHEVVSLVFYDLPLHLKRCIVYFNVFTEQPAMIHSEKLIRLWIAEGFVRKTQEKTSEEVAEECLRELVGRCLVESCEGFCRSHDVVRHVVRMKATNRDYWPSYSYSDGNGDTDSAESFRWENISQSSFRSEPLSFFSDDMED